MLQDLIKEMEQTLIFLQSPSFSHPTTAAPKSGFIFIERFHKLPGHRLRQVSPDNLNSYRLRRE
jgi:hypothetical protein